MFNVIHKPNAQGDISSHIKIFNTDDIFTLHFYNVALAWQTIITIGNILM